MTVRRTDGVSSKPGNRNERARAGWRHLCTRNNSVGTHNSVGATQVPARMLGDRMLGGSRKKKKKNRRKKSLLRTYHSVRMYTTRLGHLAVTTTATTTTCTLHACIFRRPRREKLEARSSNLEACVLFCVCLVSRVRPAESTANRCRAESEPFEPGAGCLPLPSLWRPAIGTGRASRNIHGGWAGNGASWTKRGTVVHN